jgi:predicted enzyme related to lactoylglutathione lyase
MSEAPPPVGSIGWFDLTVPDAIAVRDFYGAVTGWTWTGLDMGGYEDYCMNQPGDGTTVAGICHARGGNASVPPQWLPYIIVADSTPRATARWAARCWVRRRWTPEALRRHPRPGVTASALFESR